jgi:hypothetical protein
VVDDRVRVHLEPVLLPGPTCSLQAELDDVNDGVDGDSDCGSERSELEDTFSSSEDEESLGEEEGLTLSMSDQMDLVAF